MSYPLNIREEELKNKVAEDYFSHFDSTKIVDNIDFCICGRSKRDAPQLFPDEPQHFLWAEAKKGEVADIVKLFTQLILTIGKKRIFNKTLPPKFLGAFDSQKIEFIPYNDIQEVFYQNDFNWNVTPSNTATKEFEMVYQKVESIIKANALHFVFEEGGNKELRSFIKDNFNVSDEHNKIQIDKNNFVSIYNRWLERVKPTIMVDWDRAKKSGIIDGDFYLADLLSAENQTLIDKLFVILEKDAYTLNRKIDDAGLFTSSSATFNDKQQAHTQFWNIYERPPREEYWDYILKRRDLLVPQDVREWKGSFFTPRQWVELSQKYLADVLGENWQDEYYVWDCAAGTGNLLAGLVNKNNIWASTLDVQDVEVMKERIKNGANLWENQVFQFDFLNDDFSKLPEGLRKIIDDEAKRKKLLIYINPPYAEAGNKKLNIGIKNKVGVNQTKGREKYQQQFKKAIKEIYAQFLIRIYKEIQGCVIGEFSTLKTLQSPDFMVFRDNFRAKLEKCFIVPADTFDNVKGQFPIGFKIWDTKKEEVFKATEADIFDHKEKYLGKKTSVAPQEVFNKWIKSFGEGRGKSGEKRSNSYNYIAFLEGLTRSSFQHNNNIYILNSKEDLPSLPKGIWVTEQNLIPVAICFGVRKSIKATWLNDRDQFLYPNDGWETDTEFQNDCLAYTIFHPFNRIKFEEGVTNHWIPFTERQLGLNQKLESHFITDFIAGKRTATIKSQQELQLEPQNTTTANNNGTTANAKLEFSAEATALFNAGLEIWKYYLGDTTLETTTTGNPINPININASLYDIKRHFQGVNDKGRMNPKSTDTTYNTLNDTLKEKIKIIEKKIEPKIYQYGFLRE